jgi:hypothetical protein
MALTNASSVQLVLLVVTHCVIFSLHMALFDHRVPLGRLWLEQKSEYFETEEDCQARPSFSSQFSPGQRPCYFHCQY